MLTRKAFVLSVIISLSVGIGALNVGVTAAHRVIAGPLPFPAAEQVVFGEASWSNSTSSGKPFATTADFIDQRDLTKSFESLAAIAGSSPASMKGVSVIKTAEGSLGYVSSAEISYNFFDALGIQPLTGRNFQKNDESGRPTAAMISYRIWRARFAQSTDTVGKMLNLDGESYEIVGILPAAFDFPAGVDVWTPMPLENARKAPRRSAAGIRAVMPVGRLRSSISLAEAQADVNAVMQRLAQTYPATNTGVGLRLRPSREALYGGFRLPVLILGFAGICVLLVSIFNVIQLNVARASERSKEMAIRLALGATPRDLLRLLMIELGVVCIIGGLIGTIIGMAAQKGLVAIGLSPQPQSIDSPFLVGIIVIAATGVLGLIAAFSGLRLNLAADTSPLRSRTTIGHPSQRIYFRLATLTQVALAFVLITGTGLLLLTLNNLTRVDAGFATAQTSQMLLTFPPAMYPTRENRIGVQRQIASMLREKSGIVAAGMIDAVPLVGSTNVIIYKKSAPDGRQADVTFSTDVHWLSPGALEALDVTLLAGRTFDEREGIERTNSIVINRELARQAFPGGEALGQSLTFGAGSGLQAPQVIIGIVENVKHRSLDQNSIPTVYKASYALMWVHVIVRTRPDAAVDLSALQSEILKVNPNIPGSEIIPFSSILDRSLQGRRYQAFLVALFGGVTTLLACFGVFATAWYSVAQRSSEFAVRKALGATNGVIGAQVIRESIVLAAPGLIIGVGISLVICRLVAAHLYGITSYDFSVYGFSIFVMAAAIALSAAVPAWIAAGTPVSSASRPL